MTAHPDHLVRDLPVVADRMLLELANSAVVALDLTSFRREQSATAALLARITGKDRKREILTARALVDGQQALTAWAAELTGHAQVTDIAVGLVAESLSRTRGDVSRLAADSAHTTARLEQLAEVVARVAEVCERRFTEAEKRLAALEEEQRLLRLRQEAEESFELSVGRWSVGQSYAHLPWPFQTVLLAREVAAGPAGRHASLMNSTAFEERLVHRILQSPRTQEAPQEPFLLVEVIDEAARAVDNPEMLRLVGEVLGNGLEPSLAMPSGPLNSVLATALELWTLPGNARPGHPAETAHALVHRREGQVLRTYSPKGYVRQIVAEQFRAARLVRERLSAARPELPGNHGHSGTGHPGTGQDGAPGPSEVTA